MKGPHEKPLGLDMSFGEALGRFIGVDPAELPESSRLVRKKERPPKQSLPAREKKDAEPLD